MWKTAKVLARAAMAHAGSPTPGNVGQGEHVADETRSEIRGTRVPVPLVDSKICTHPMRERQLFHVPEYPASLLRSMRSSQAKSKRDR